MNMSRLKRGLQKIKDDPWKIILYMNYFGLLRFLNDEACVKLLYKARYSGRRLNLENPKTFNEKMQWLKLYDRKSEYSQMVDKYEAKKYVAEIIGEEYIIPTIGIWHSFNDIDFDRFPNQFVLKCTHDSGSVIICHDKNKFSKEDAKKKIKRALKTNQYRIGREWPYKNVKPRILAEQYMEDSVGRGELTDYKIHCYNGVPKVIQIISNRLREDGMRNDHYTTDWERLDLRRGHYRNAEGDVKRPDELPQLLELAAILSSGIPYIRVDFYIVNHRIYFGELTFFPASGFNPFDPDFYDGLFGSWIELPIDK